MSDLSQKSLAISSISYVIPTLNSAATLDMTLYALRSQQDIEVNIIVVDSGSTDETLDICKRWDVKILYAEPGNMYRAINVGLRECNTEWLGYINSDDWLYSDSIARLITKGNATNADVVYGNCDYTDGQGRFLYSLAAPHPNRLGSIFRTSALGFAQQAAIFRNRLYQKLQGFNEKYRLNADKDFYFRALISEGSFAFLPGLPVACFRLHKNQLSNKQAQSMQAERQQILAELANDTTFYDWLVMMQWKLRNTPHYLLRFLRQSLISRKLIITRSIQAGTLSDNIEQIIFK